MMDEVRDRYGPPPASVLNLAEYASIRLMADRIGVEALDREGQIVVIKFRSDARLDPTWLLRVIQERGDVVLVPPASLKVDLKSAPGSVAGASRRRSIAAPRGKGGDPVAGGSWWAARARTGEVAPGFSRDEILRPVKEDPRAEGGLFTRVGSLLRELSEGLTIA